MQREVYTPVVGGHVVITHCLMVFRTAGKAEAISRQRVGGDAHCEQATSLSQTKTDPRHTKQQLKDVS